MAEAPGLPGLLEPTCPTTVEDPPACDRMEEAMDCAAVTGHTVVVSATVCVTTTPPVANRAGQLVILAAQAVTVLTTVW